MDGVIVGAALVRDGKLLAQQRAWPPHHAGQWELPGGRVEEGETDAFALARECQEELDVTVTIGQRVGAEVPLPGGKVLRVYTAALISPGRSRAPSSTPRCSGSGRKTSTTSTGCPPIAA